MLPITKLNGIILVYRNEYSNCDDNFIYRFPQENFIVKCGVYAIGDDKSHVNAQRVILNLENDVIFKREAKINVQQFYDTCRRVGVDLAKSKDYVDPESKIFAIYADPVERVKLLNIHSNIGYTAEFINEYFRNDAIMKQYIKILNDNI